MVKLFLLELPKKMHFQKLADDVAASCEGPSGEEALNKLNTVVNEADQRMEEKIEMVSTEVGARMKVLMCGRCQQWCNSRFSKIVN